MATPIPSLQPFVLQQPDLATSFQQRDVGRQQRELADLNIQQARNTLGQQERTATADVRAIEQEQIIDSIDVFSRVTDQASFDTALNLLAVKYPDSIEGLRQLANNVAPGGQFDPQSTPQLLNQVVGNLEQKQASAFTLSPGQARFTGAGEQIAAVPGKPTKEAQKFSDPEQDEFGNIVQTNLTTGERKVISRPKSGERISVGPDGEVLIERGPEVGGPIKQAPGLGTAATNRIQTDLIDAQNGLVRMSAIEQSFKPEFLQLSTRIGAKITSLKDFVGKPLNEQEQQDLEEFSVFQQDSITNINLFIKEITGAAMSAQEAVRIRQGMPDPGEGIFDGDSPTVFKSKLDNTLTKLRLSTARLNFINNNGFTITRDKEGNSTGFFDDQGQGITINNMKGIMNQRANEIGVELQAANTGLDNNQIREMVRQRVAGEFGLNVQ